MRGKVDAMAVAGLGARITPAHAGKSFSGDFDFARREDHPRPCGEKRMGAGYFARW